MTASARFIAAVACAACAGVWGAVPAAGAESQPPPSVELAPTRYGLGLSAGWPYNPAEEDVRFFQVHGCILYDYDRVWPHRAPEGLRFKVEANAGSTVAGRAMASANVMAHLYAPRGPWAGVWPYAEAGIGAIYTDFRVEGQGLRFNFNPQAGVGMEFGGAAGRDWFAAVRLHHVSNANLDDENRGINSVLVLFGRYL